jgi:osmotically-inducible protein OsmY
MKSDQDIQRDVEAELKWSPDVNEKDVAVKVNTGVAVLTGYVNNYLEKYRAEVAAKRVAGVAGVANDIVVRAPRGDGLQDPEIARAAVTAIRMDLPLTAGKIQVTLHDGHATLSGNVEWNFQREAAERAVRRVLGITGVRNHIELVPQVQPSEVKHKIEEAFRRSAEIDANQISVQANDGTVILRGKVRNWSERTQAQNTAWSAPGVLEVRNEIQIAT